ncbi:glycosyl transferase family 4-domain-containing protein, partial [Thamnocephalis sphaerospora]
LAAMLLAGLATFLLIPRFGPAFASAGRRGRDLLKPGRPELPESLGLAVAAIYLVVLFLLIPFPFLRWIEGEDGAGWQFRFPEARLGDMLSALLSLQSMALLGFADDVFDIRWRHKLLLPCVAAIPLLAVYYESGGGTAVMVPLPLRSLLGSLIDLGPLYYIYMSMMSIFCTNAINILAGINGLEVGQSVVIAMSIAANDFLYLGNSDPAAVNAHLFSLHFMLPFIGVSLALLWHNWFPARVFVGDTYCYFAGMTFAVVSILGHFSKTVLLFFIPQVFNFVYSVPQLFHRVPCPRHRMPKLNEATGLLEPSEADLKVLSRTGRAIIDLYARLGMAREAARDPDRPVRSSNFTLINLLLVHLGPMREDRLCLCIMALQVLGSAIAFWIRYRLVYLAYDQ